MIASGDGHVVNISSLFGLIALPGQSAYNAGVVAGLSPTAKVVYTRQDDLTAALVAGEVDAMSADSPVMGFAVKLSGGARPRTGRW